MDELTLLRRLVADEPTDYEADRAEVWRRLRGGETMRSQRRRRITLAVAATVTVILGTFSAYATARELFDPYPGGRVTRTVDSVRFSFRIPVKADIWRNVPDDERWENGPIERTGDTANTWVSRNFLFNRSTVGGQAAEAVIFWTTFPEGGQAAACTRLLSTAPRSTADLAAAVARAPGVSVVKGPRRVTLGGRPAHHVVVAVRRDLGCDPGYFFTWPDQWWGAFWPGTYAGDVISMWIVDVDGTRLVIEAETKRPRSQYPAARIGAIRVTRADVLKVEREIKRIVESIRFE